MAHGFITALSGSQIKPPALPEVYDLVAFLRWNLFTYRNLWEWIDSPFDTLPIEPKSVQYPIPFRGFGQHLALRTT